MSSRSGKRDSDSSESTLSDSTSWIRWYCELRGNEFFCEIDEEFVQDDFNLTGLATMVPNYEYALDVILDVENDDTLTEEQQEMIEAAAESLYGLIHARFILTSRGMALMLDKYQKADFGRCPRVFCHGQNVLPVGQSDVPRINTAKVFCPRCRDLYFPKYSRHANVDGAYFGTTFPHLLMQTYPELVVPRPTQAYVPRIYGFKIHESATNAPRPPAAAMLTNNSAPVTSATSSTINSTNSTTATSTTTTATTATAANGTAHSNSNSHSAPTSIVGADESGSRNTTNSSSITTNRQKNHDWSDDESPRSNKPKDARANN